MDTIHILRLLDTMIDYFEAGNKETDRAAKSILETDVAFKDYWQEEIKRIGEGVGWTGLRAIEADILAASLRTIKSKIEECG